MTADLETVESTYRTAYACPARVGPEDCEWLTIGVTDERGRVVGLTIARFDAQLAVLHDVRTGEPIARGHGRHHGAWQRRPGTVYAWCARVTRDGRVHGNQGKEARAFATREEREADIAAYVANFTERHAN